MTWISDDQDLLYHMPWLGHDVLNVQVDLSKYIWIFAT